MKYLKTWMGKSAGGTGGFAGDSGGYPEMQFRIIESIDDLVKTYDAKAKYFKLTEVNVSTVVSVVADFKGLP